MRSVLNIHWKDWCWSWNSNTLATWCEESTHWKRPWYWERLKAGGEGDNRGWDGWMTSLTCLRKLQKLVIEPGGLQPMGSQRLRRDWTELRIRMSTQVSQISLNNCYSMTGDWWAEFKAPSISYTAANPRSQVENGHPGLVISTLVVDLTLRTWSHWDSVSWETTLPGYLSLATWRSRDLLSGDYIYATNATVESITYFKLSSVQNHFTVIKPFHWMPNK